MTLYYVMFMQKNEKNKKTFCRPLTNNTAYRFLNIGFMYAIKNWKKWKNENDHLRKNEDHLRIIPHIDFWNLNLRMP